MARKWPARLDLGLLAVGAWACVSLGAAVRHGTYTPVACVLVTAGVLLLTVIALVLAGHEVRPPSRFSLLLACAIALASTALSPAVRDAHGTSQTISHLVLTVGAVVLLAMAGTKRYTPQLHILLVVLAVAAGIFGIRAYPHPGIDDWNILQGSARAVLHFQNSYGAAWPGAKGHLLPYLPASAVLLTPFWVVFSDVRFGLLAALVLASLVISRLQRAPRSHTLLVLSGLVLFYPWVMYGIEDSWPEPLMLALIASMVLAIHRGRPGLAVVCFALALLTKQHVALLVPFAAVWPAFGWRRALASGLAAAIALVPWVATAPHMFWQGAVVYNLTLPPRADSLSLFTAASRAGHSPSFAIVPIGTLVVLVLGLWKLPRTASGFVFGSAWILAVFNLLNKQSFFNEWSLVVGLIVLGMATMTVADHPRTAAGSALGTHAVEHQIE
jgi:hypothetical protein